MIKTTKLRGFTIVELLIVIVVIGILAAITIVAYNGIQSRATAAKTVSDITAVNKAVQLYYADNGSYPNTSSAWSGIGGQSNYVPGLVPTYISALPSQPTITSTVYMYISNGPDYKLIVHDNAGSAGTGAAKLCPIVTASNLAIRDPLRNCWAYGYWSTDGGPGF